MTKDPRMGGSGTGKKGTSVCLAAGLVAVLFSPGVATAASTVTGTITFDGKPPVLRPIAMDAEPVCAKKHAGHAVQPEMLVLGTGQTMGNVMVYVSKGIPAGKTYPAPKEPVTVDQEGCMYIPHVMGIQVHDAYDDVV